MSVPPLPSLLPVAITGARGAYSQRAAERFFGHSRTLLTSSSVDAAVQAVRDGRASHAVLPVENSITGPFPGVAEALFEAPVAVVGEVVLPIRHCLLAVPGAQLSDLTVVTSHPSALAQCRDRLMSWGVAARPSSDTGQAAEDLARSGNKSLGVLGSRELAAYGLEVLCEGLSDHPGNSTRFLVLASSAEEAPAPDGRRGALLVGPITAPRTLKTLRIQLESLGATSVRVPFLGSEDGTRFLVEFDHRSRPPREVADDVGGSLPYRFLGAWTPATPASSSLRAS